MSGQPPQSSGSLVAGGLLPLMAALAVACGPGVAGDRAWKRGEIERAVELYQQAAELDDQRSQRLARGLAGSGGFNQAQELLGALPQELWTPDGWMAQGLLLLERGQPGEAAVAFATGARLGGDASLLVNHSGALLAAGTPDASVCADALVAAPLDPAAMLGLAAASLAEENVVVVHRTLQNLLATEGVSSLQLQEAGKLLLAGGDPGSACMAYLAAGGGGVPGGEACIRAGRTDEANSILEPLVDQEPQAAFMLGTLALERALSSRDSGERARAVADASRRFRVCAGAYAADPSWYNNVGRLHALDGVEQAAEVAFRKALELDSTAAYPALNLARLLEARGERDESGELLQRVAAGGGQLAAMAGLDLARRARTAGDTQRALEFARGMLAGCEGGGAQACVVESCIVIGTLLARDDPEQALALLQRAAEIGGSGVGDRLAVEPDLTVLAGDARFAALVEGLPPEG